MAQNFLNQKYKWIFWRKKIFGVEFDLGFINQRNELYLVECKSISSWEWVDIALSTSQKKRLQIAKIRLFNTGIYKNVYLRVAIIVGKLKQLNFFDL